MPLASILPARATLPPRLPTPTLPLLRCGPPAPPAPLLQRKALALIGAAGRRGALQNDMAIALGFEHRNFFYVVKVGAPASARYMAVGG